MKNRTRAWILAVCTGIFVLTGCGGQKQEIYEQAERDLEQGSYEYALQGYQASVANEYKMAESYRGAGISSLRLGDYEGAITAFAGALDCEKISKSLARDVLFYKVTAELKAGRLDDAMADCQTLAEDYSMTAETYFLTGKTALSMDSYDEASSNFQQAYAENPSYEMAFQIYEAYLERDMEADGTRYLEAILQTEAKSAEDYCDRGRAYYYMQDYENAQKALIEASNKGSTDALLFLGSVYLAQNDVSNARSMYQQYVETEGTSGKGYNGLALCDLAEGNYDGALANISSGIECAGTEEMQDLLYNEVVAYEKKLDFASAQQKAQNYLEMYPDDENMSRELTFLQSRTGTLTSAGNAQ